MLPKIKLLELIKNNKNNFFSSQQTKISKRDCLNKNRLRRFTQSVHKKTKHVYINKNSLQ